MPLIQSSGNTDLFYNDWGSGKPVVLIHGWPLDADMWEHQSVFLAKNGYRVVAYDRRGFGRSSQPWNGYDYDTFADDLKAVLDGLDIQGATLVGFSMGGGEVARYLSKYGSQRVSKAVLISAVTPFLLQTAGNSDGVPKSTFDQMVNGLEKDRPNFLATFNKQFFGAGLLNFSVSNEIMEWSRQVAMLASPKATVDCVRAFSETDFRADLAKIDVPTLVIHGDDDQTVPIDKSGALAAKLIPNAEYTVYKGEPHGLFHTAKDRLNEDLKAFIG
jgi:non-heme chloroperoxidase